MVDKKIIIITIVLLSFYIISNSHAEITGIKSVTQTNISKPVLSVAKEEKNTHLSWNNIDNAFQYVLERSTDGRNFVQIKTTENKNYTDSNLGEGTYYYRIKAIGNVLVQHNGYYQAKSGGAGTTRNTYQLGINSATITINYDMYGVPDELIVYYDGRVIAETDGQVKGSDTLTFQYNPQSGGPYEIEVVVIGPQGTVWDYDLVSPPFYLEETRESDYSTVVSAIISYPKLWVFWPTGGQDVEVDWESGYLDLNGYMIELFRRDTISDNWMPVKSIGENEKNSFIWLDKNVTANLNYKYQIRVFNLSTWEWETLIESNWAELERPFAAPGGLKISNKTDTNATVTWKMVDGAVSYITEVSTNNGFTWQPSTVSTTNKTVPRPCVFRVKAGTHARSQYSGLLYID